MTAFLNIDDLRAHAAPFDPYEMPRRAEFVRPVLSAHWFTTPDGRLTCRWQTDEPAPDRPPQ
jgi:hypothetical protein